MNSSVRPLDQNYIISKTIAVVGMVTTNVIIIVITIIIILVIISTIQLIYLAASDRCERSICHLNYVINEYFTWIVVDNFVR